MARTAMVQARMEPELKNKVENILNALGINTTDAINISLSRCSMRTEYRLM